MTNYEWLLQMGGEERQAWFDAEHVDAHSKAQSKTGQNLSEQSESLSDEADSREKLEADVRKWCAMMGMQPYQLDFVYGWLDRQAAITANETSHDNPYVGLVRGKQWERTERSDYYCGKCGWKVTDHNSYCPECGGALHGAPNKPDGKFDARETAESAENVTSKNEIHNFDDSREQLEAEYAEPHKVNMKRYFKPFIEAAQRAIDVENDSREKLEADIDDYLESEYGIVPGVVAMIPEWLDRQAAIAERETKLRELYKFEENHRYHIRSIEEVNQKLNKRIAELTAERDELKAMNERLQVALDAVEGCDERCLKLESERDALADDLLTCNKEREEYRELFSKAITQAAEIVNLQP